MVPSPQKIPRYLISQLSKLRMDNMTLNNHGRSRSVTDKARQKWVGLTVKIPEGDMHTFNRMKYPRRRIIALNSLPEITQSVFQISGLAGLRFQRDQSHILFYTPGPSESAPSISGLWH